MGGPWELQPPVLGGQGPSLLRSKAKCRERKARLWGGISGTAARGGTLGWHFSRDALAHESRWRPLCSLSPSEWCVGRASVSPPLISFSCGEKVLLLFQCVAGHLWPGCSSQAPDHLCVFHGSDTSGHLVPSLEGQPEITAGAGFGGILPGIRSSASLTTTNKPWFVCLLGFLLFRDFCQSDVDEGIPQLRFYEEVKRPCAAFPSLPGSWRFFF